MKLHVRFFKHLIPLKGKYIYNLLPISITFLSFASYVQNVADNLLFGGVGLCGDFPLGRTVAALATDFCILFQGLKSTEQER